MYYYSSFSTHISKNFCSDMKLYRIARVVKRKPKYDKSCYTKIKHFTFISAGMVGSTCSLTGRFLDSENVFFLWGTGWCPASCPYKYIHMNGSDSWVAISVTPTQINLDFKKFHSQGWSFVAAHGIYTVKPYQIYSLASVAESWKLFICQNIFTFEWPVQANLGIGILQ